MAEPETTLVAGGLPSERNTSPTVFVPMAADLVHAGHINILNVSRQYGRVIVGLMTDQGMQSYKRAPILPFEQRQAVVRSFFQVDEVIQLHGKDYSEPLLRMKPNFMVHGSDWSDPSSPQFPSRAEAIKLMASWGGRVIEPEYTTGISTTDIIKCCAHRHCSAEREKGNHDANGSETSKAAGQCLSGHLRYLRLMLGVAPAVLPHHRNLSLCLYLASHVLGALTGIYAQQKSPRRDIICDQTVGLASGVAFSLGVCLPSTAPPTLAAPCCAVLSVEAARSMLVVGSGAVETGKSGSGNGCWTAFDSICSVAQHLFLSSLWCWAADPRNMWLSCMAAMAPFVSWKFLQKCTEVKKLLHA